MPVDGRKAARAMSLFDDEVDDRAQIEFYQHWFASEPLNDLMASVAVTHVARWTEFLGELQAARGLLYRSNDEDARIGGYLRGYRAIDTFDTALSHAIVHAFAAPFRALFEKPIKPWRFFHESVLFAITRRVYDESFHGPEVREALDAFYRDHDPIRNEVVHGLRVPTHDEFRSMLLDAIRIYDLADRALNPQLNGGAPHIPVLGPEDYPHDDYVPEGVVNPPARPA